MKKCFLISASAVALLATTSAKCDTVIYQDNSKHYIGSYLYQVIETGSNIIKGVKYLLGELTNPSNTPKTQEVSIEKQWSTTESSTGSISATAQASVYGQLTSATLSTTLANSRSATDTYKAKWTITACCSTEKLWGQDIFSIFTGTYIYMEAGLGYTPVSGTWTVKNFTGVSASFEHIPITCPGPVAGASIATLPALLCLIAFRRKKNDSAISFTARPG